MDTKVIDTLKKDTLTREVPVIFLTGKSLSREGKGELAAGIEGVVRKSPDNKELLVSEVKKSGGLAWKTKPFW
ncbi:MAG: hypothetical protein K8R45_08000 [Desulfobacterales bacterium]|nr:hypothetical protein [Desulfobacterales bacterium]